MRCAQTCYAYRTQPALGLPTLGTMLLPYPSDALPLASVSQRTKVSWTLSCWSTSGLGIFAGVISSIRTSQVTPQHKSHRLHKPCRFKYLNPSQGSLDTEVKSVRQLTAAPYLPTLIQATRVQRPVQQARTAAANFAFGATSRYPKRDRRRRSYSSS